MAADKAPGARSNIARMRKLTRDVSKLNGKIHSATTEKTKSSSSSGKARKG
jgi:hypothetical protein